MPVVVFVLAAAVFALGTSEFIVSGLLDQVAADCAVSVASAGLLTSVFAAGMVLGAPAMVMAVSAIPRRAALICFLGLFAVSHIVGALTRDFALLLGMRAVAAVANAGFLAVTLAALPGLVTATAVGRATSVILSGVTVACVLGVPGGTILGQAFGWHAAFWAIAIIASIALAALCVVSAGTRIELRHRDDRADPVWREWRTLARRGLLIVVLLGVLINAATFAGFTYLGTIAGALTTPAGPWISVALALFGIGSFAGVTLAGRYSDRYRDPLIVAGCAVLAVVWLASVTAAHTLAGLLVLALLSGAGAFGVGSVVITAIVQTAAPSAPRIAGAVATTALNAGAIVGPAVAGIVVTDAAHAPAALWVSTAFTIAAAVVAFVAVSPRLSTPR